MATKADNLTLQSLEWALSHVQRFGDTDIFPVPFEYEAIAKDKAVFLEALERVDLTSHETGGTMRFLVPKPRIGFRIAHQLDPLDALIYTAAAYEMATAIEDSRVAEDAHVACSYRIHIQPDGRFFADDTGWPDFQEQSAELVEDATHVLVADIADFYNQLSHHRIENALETASVPNKRAKNIERLLGSLTAKQSRGLPVGPFGSIILAEAAMTDVDAYLMKNGVAHTRYVDDFRIFGSEKECTDALYHLTEFLYTAHRLCLQSSKTRIRGGADFKERELTRPELEEQKKKMGRLKEMIKEIYDHTGYSVELDELDDKVSGKALREALKQMFHEQMRRSVLNIGPVRYILRRAKNLRTREIHEAVLEHLEFLAPIFRDVCDYLDATMPKKSTARKAVGHRLLSLAQKSIAGRYPFIRMWVLSLVAKHPYIMDEADTIRLAERTKSIRQRALVARAYNDVAWVRSMKEVLATLGPWDQRAVIWAASILPKDESRNWLKPLVEGGDPLKRAVALAATAR